MKILWAVLTEFRTVGPFELNWETQQYKCWISQYITFALLVSLQAVNLFWLYLIMRILKKYILDDVAQDERSEDEEEEEEEANASKAAAGGINGAEGVSSQVSVNGTSTDGRKRK